MLTTEEKQAIIKEHARHEGDTGSPEVQIAVLTTRIAALTEQILPSQLVSIHPPKCLVILYINFKKNTNVHCKKAKKGPLFQAGLLFANITYGYSVWQ